MKHLAFDNRKDNIKDIVKDLAINHFDNVWSKATNRILNEQEFSTGSVNINETKHYHTPYYPIAVYIIFDLYQDLQGDKFVKKLRTT